MNKKQLLKEKENHLNNIKQSNKMNRIYLINTNLTIAPVQKEKEVQEKPK